MEKKQSSRKWTSDETNLFWEILANPVSNFMETLEKRVLKNHLSTRGVFDSIIAEFKERLENAQFKGKIQKTLK